MLVVRPSTILTGHQASPWRSPHMPRGEADGGVNICGVAARHRSERGTVSRSCGSCPALDRVGNGCARMPPRPPSASASWMRGGRPRSLQAGSRRGRARARASLSNPALRRPLTTDCCRRSAAPRFQRWRRVVVGIRRAHDHDDLAPCRSTARRARAYARACRPPKPNFMSSWESRAPCRSDAGRAHRARPPSWLSR